MTEKKITKKEYFGMVISVIEKSDTKNKEEIVDFIRHEIELLDRKAGNSKKIKNQESNATIKNIILEVLSEHEKPITVSEMLEDVRLSTYTEEKKEGEIETKKMTNQKLSSLVTQLKAAGAIIRTEEKKKAYFALTK